MHYSAFRGISIELQCLNATFYALFTERRDQVWSKRWKIKQRNAAEFLGSILHHVNSFSILTFRAAIG